jgi:ribonuclease PH
MTTRIPPRSDGRRADQLREVVITRGYTDAAPGSVLMRIGRTMVLCTASIQEAVPSWREPSGLGWVTAEYEMLPASTGQRRSRPRPQPDGRSTEIQRLIGRVLRSVVDFAKLGPRTIWLDCDVIQADGGTRAAAITGAYVALADAVRQLKKQKRIAVSPVIAPVAAISVGRVSGKLLLDLDYREDSSAEVDFNVAMTGTGRLIEVQGGGEGNTFTRRELDRMLLLGGRGIRQLIARQERALAGRKK